jgi:lipopolysaccharide biosynthesis regulator YciM
MTLEELLAKAREAGPVRYMTRSQAMGSLYQARNEIDEAVQVYRQIHATGRWTGGVHLMAKAELLRLSVKP